MDTNASSYRKYIELFSNYSSAVTFVKVITETRNTLDCDQSNVYSSHAVFSAISQGLFRSFSLYRRSAGDPPS